MPACSERNGLAIGEHYLTGRKIRSDRSGGDIDFEEDFYILANTHCAACLTENGFQDSKESLAYITSAEGKRAVTRLHVEGICDYLDSIR